MLKVKKLLTEIIANNTGQSSKKAEADMERNNWMTSEEALNYGLIDKIIK
jgi:ATP-dependent Clp protease protease subunit